MKQISALKGLVNNKIIDFPCIKFEQNIIEINEDSNFVGNSFLYPGLINAHEHLRINCIGPYKTTDYNNSKEWVEEHRHTPNFIKIDTFNRQNLLNLFGTYKNLMSGVTTLLNFGPYEKFISQNEIQEFPISVSENADFHLFLNENHFKVNKGKRLITIHIGEGKDKDSMNELKVLHELGGVTNHTLLVHGIAFSDEDLKLISKNKSSIAWCPKSNEFLIGNTLNIKKALELDINIALCTDSTMSGSDNIFEELRFAREYCKKNFNYFLSAETLVNMVTVNSAKALLRNDIGIISKGYKADFLVTDILHNNIYENLLMCKSENIQILYSRGIPVFGDFELMKEFSNDNKYSEYICGSRKKLVKGNPLKLIKELTNLLEFQPYKCF